MSTNNTNHYNINNIQNLEKEKENLMVLYKNAIENDLPFEKTKNIYLRLKEIKLLLENQSTNEHR